MDELEKEDHIGSDDGQLVPAHAVLLSDTSLKRAKELLSRHHDGNFTYYVMSKETPAAAPQLELFVQSLNPPIQEFTRFATDPGASKWQASPVNDAMLRAIKQAVEDYNESGAITLTREMDPKKADIFIASSDLHKRGASGITSDNRKNILLDERFYRPDKPAPDTEPVKNSIQQTMTNEAAFSNERYIAVHEIGHALGLEHPHAFQKGSGGPSSNAMPCSSSVMIHRGHCRGVFISMGLREADIDALRTLYGAQGVAVPHEPPPQQITQDVKPVGMDGLSIR